MTRGQPILRILDDAADRATFPVLDNGYVYLAAARLALFRSEVDWAITFELFGFSPRTELPDIAVWTVASSIRSRKAPDDFVSRAAFERYLEAHQNDDSAFFFPIEPGDWQDHSGGEFTSAAARHIVVRGRRLDLPRRDKYAAHGIDVAERDRIATHELCRYLATIARDDVLATTEERRTNVPPELMEILVLDDWHHPDVAGGERPSQTAAFRSIAEVLVSGDVTAYQSTERPNTHWSNWPLGGTL